MLVMDSYHRANQFTNQIHPSYSIRRSMTFFLPLECLEVENSFERQKGADGCWMLLGDRV